MCDCVCWPIWIELVAKEFFANNILNIYVFVKYVIYTLHALPLKLSYCSYIMFLLYLSHFLYSTVGSSLSPNLPIYSDPFNIYLCHTSVHICPIYVTLYTAQYSENLSSWPNYLTVHNVAAPIQEMADVPIDLRL